MIIIRRIAILFAFITMSIATLAQGTTSDYKRAFALQERFNNKVYYDNVNPEWIGNSHLLWYSVNTPKGTEYFLVDARKKTKTPLFDNKLLAAALAAQSGKEVSAEKLGLERVRINHQDTLGFAFNGYWWTYVPKKNKLIKKDKNTPRSNNNNYWGDRNDERRGDPITSPDGKKLVYIKNHNVYVKDVNGNNEKSLSFDGAEGEYYSAYIQWSLDSKKVAVMRIRANVKKYIRFIESSPQDQLQPKLHEREYLKPGDALPLKTPCIFDVETGKITNPSNDLFPNPYWVDRMKWNADSKSTTFEYNERGHQLYRVLELNAETGAVRTLVDESSKTFVNYNRYYRLDLKNGQEMIWMSERDNWNHLYLYNTGTGQVKQQITKGTWYVREVIDVDEQNKLITFTANGMSAGEDPYLVKYYRIAFDGSGLVCLTPEEGMHKAWFSKNKDYVVDSYSKVNMPPITVLRDTKDGQIIMTLEKADISELQKAGWIAPEPFIAKGRDGITDIWGVIVRPTNFDPAKKYPVIEYIYAGPGSHYVPKLFASFYWTMSALAELGFIVVQIDGMGTSFRSKAFEDIICKNLKDAGLPDRIAWIKAAAAKYPYMDADKVGIFGGSAGGQNAMTATLFYPDFYKAAYSACGCHDNRMDKIWWNEQWMGYPIGEQYAASSNVENAHLLKTPLMLVVGEMDDNVDPASTYQVANALINANKDFELVTLPGVGHTLGNQYGEHKRFDFFVKHLMGVQPPKWNDL